MACMDKDIVDRVIDKYGGEPGALIQILLDLQGELRWLPREALERISERLDVPLSRIRHLATYYKAFSLVPKGRHEVCVCMGTACHVRGASRVLEAVQEATGIAPGETDLDLNFSLRTVNCLGCCALGPVVEIDGKIYGGMTSAGVADVLREFKEEEGKACLE